MSAPEGYKGHCSRCGKDDQMLLREVTVFPMSNWCDNCKRNYAQAYEIKLSEIELMYSIRKIEICFIGRVKDLEKRHYFANTMDERCKRQFLLYSNASNQESCDKIAADYQKYWKNNY